MDERWDVIPTKVRIGVGGHDFEVWIVADHAAERDVAYVFDREHADQIAAVPDLLAALSKAAPTQCVYQPRNMELHRPKGWPDTCRCAYHDARAAIAKATKA